MADITAYKLTHKARNKSRLVFADELSFLLGIELDYINWVLGIDGVFTQGDWVVRCIA